MTATTSADPCVGSTEIYFSTHPDDIELARALCAACPLSRRSRCARDAIEAGDKFGVWAGVYLPGMQPRDKDRLDEAVDQLRRIAGDLDRCRQCWAWFRIVEDGTSHAARSDAHCSDSHDVAGCGNSPAAHRYERLCPACARSDSKELPADTPEQHDRGQLVDLPPSGDPWVRHYWERRHRGRRGDEGDWLLIDADGQVEGQYAWSTAAQTFGRTPARFRAMIADGWTVRRAGVGDRFWHQPEAAAAAPVSA